MNKNIKIIKSFSLGVFLSLVSKVLSFLITFLLMYKFGTSREIDIFVTISSFVMMFNIIVNKVFMNTVPTMYLKHESQKEKDTFFSSMIFITIIISIASVLVFIFASSIIIKGLAPGFNEMEVEKGSQLLKILSISMMFNIMSSIIISYLRATERTNPIYFKDVIVNGIVCSFILLASRSINVIALYYTFAYFIKFIYLLIVFKTNYPSKISFGLPGIKAHGKRFMWLALPIFLTTGANEIKNIVDKIFASFLQEGAITALNFSYRVIGLPVNILGGVLVTVIFAKLVEASNNKSFTKVVSNLFTVILICVIPISFFVLIKGSLIAATFSGMNSSINSLLLSSTIRAYSFCIFGNAMLLIINTVFYAQGKTRNTLYIAVIVTVLNIIFNSLFIESMGAMGLALSTTLASIIALVIGISLLDIGYNKIFIKHFLKKSAIVSVMSIPSIFFLILDFQIKLVSNDFINDTINLIISGFSYMIVLFLTYLVFRRINKEAFNFEN